MKKNTVFLLLILSIIFCITYSSAEEDPSKLINSAAEYCKQGKLDKAEEAYNKALKLYDEQSDSGGKAICYSGLGEIYFLIGLYEDSLSYYESAINICRSLSDKTGEGENLIDKGYVYFSLGYYEESLECYDKALKIFEEEGNKSGMGSALEHRGDVYFDLALYEKALRYHKDSLTFFTEGGDYSASAVVLCKIGEDYFISGEEEYGKEKLQEALDIARKDSSISYDILMRAGSVCDRYGEKYDSYELAINMYREAKKVVSLQGNKNREKNALMKIAGIHSIKKRDDVALSVYEEVMSLSLEGGDKKGRIDALFNAAEIYNRHNRSQKALESYEECLEFYTLTGDKWGLVKTHLKLGEIYEREEKYDKASYHYTASISELEQLRGEIKSEELKESFSEKVMPVYRRVIEFFLKTGRDKEAFHYLEMSRARALLDALIKGKVDIIHGADRELLEKDKKLQAELNYFQSLITLEKGKDEPDKARVNEIETKISLLEGELGVIRDKLIKVSPSYAFLTGLKKPLTVDELQKEVLADNQYLLEYFINEENVTVWIVSKNNFSLVNIEVPQEEIDEKIEVFREVFKDLKESPENFFEILNSFDSQCLKDLHDILFKPVTDSIAIPEETDLIIVPDGILYYIPFEVLMCNRNNEGIGSDYIINFYNISYVPSASTLDPALKKDNKEISGIYLGFGNPLFGEVPAEETFTDEVATGFMVLQGYDLIPLPDTEKQVKNIEDLFSPIGESNSYIKSEATEEKVKLESSSYKYLLFATHGLLDEEKPMESSLAFSSSSRPDEDGFLKAKEIINMEINSDLVVLSACETGLGKIKSGEGVVGLTRAFMYAGTPSVIVSLWSVESGSTAKMMEIFYGNLLSGMNKSKALREAKLSIMKDFEVIEGKKVSYAHPFFWAPFVLMGDSN